MKKRKKMNFPPCYDTELWRPILLERGWEKIPPPEKVAGCHT